MSWYDRGWRPYVSVAKQRRQAAREVANLKKAVREVAPIHIAGRKIATTFWGAAWCTNLESYSDYSNRLPRGRTYVRNGSVIDLQIEAGRVSALVSGSYIYEVEIEIAALPAASWIEIKARCAGQIGSLVELLRGSLSHAVMEIVTRKGGGLFPSPHEIALSCSCPDWATMCKHVAAALYGVGARLDHAPELLFTLRGVDPVEMIEAAVDQPLPSGTWSTARVLASDELSSVFGIDIDFSGASDANVVPTARRRKTANKKTANKKVANKKVAKRETQGSRGGPRF